MKFTEVYNVLQDYFKISSIIPLALLIVGIAFFVKYKKNKNKLIKETKHIAIAIFIIYMSTITIILLIGIFGYVNDYFKIVKPYLDKKYNIVEGYIKDFSPMPEYGHKNESFDVNGVHFEYSYFYGDAGFKKAACYGGPLKKNGQYVRIGYVKLNEVNVIVKIDLGTIR